ncbi:CbrC family protein [Pelagicoccus sp. NFK12]|uniref:CbrC family protein n=1 Tax=Pelagicoccus enzymogenes TaxID=2773457 RepID=A0A927FBY1_9BACT|nr:CbrC family protein [Pelagicoccus enzymogenes]MBD5780966.1 CbrC family protein [Pelagicoccus enzymogenes]
MGFLRKLFGKRDEAKGPPAEPPPGRDYTSLPVFKYHPDPISTGAIKKDDASCDCCGQSHGYAYKSSVYCHDEVDALCPWCIADGSAAAKFNAIFSDSHPLSENGISKEIIEEVTTKTPGFDSWQQEVWLSCCDDACEFHGDVSKAEMKAMTKEQIQKAFEDDGLGDEIVGRIKEGYEPGGSPAIYKWRCKHCGDIKHYADFT